MSQLKILMADDEKDVTDIMAKKIAAEGYEVVKAYDGQEAWTKIVSDSPDIILLDINMPHRDGFDILRELRENPPSAKWQAVIIISAQQELEDIRKGYDLEADHYITKPCQIADVTKAINVMTPLISQRRSTNS